MAEELNFQIPQQGFDSYLYGIIPDDQAVLAGAFSVSMQQIRNIEKVSIAEFAKVAYNSESTIDLPLVAGTDIPTDTPLSTAAKIKTALGSGVFGTYTSSNFFGCMSGLPYPWKLIYDKILELQTQNLTNIYKEIWRLVVYGTATAEVNYAFDGTNYVITGATVVSPGGGYTSVPTVTVNGGSGATAEVEVGTDPEDPATYNRIKSITITDPGTPNGTIPTITISDPPSDGDPPWTDVDPVTGIPVRNSLIQTQIDLANNEIEAIAETTAVNFERSKILNSLWNITGIALKHEQRARYIGLTPVIVPWDARLSSYPTSLYVFVDSIPDYGLETQPHMAAQTLEHISDLSSTGGQSIVAMMRQERNQDRLNEIGIDLDNNLSDRLNVDLERSLMTNGVLSDAVEGIGSPNGNIYTLPAWPENTTPITYVNDENDTALITELIPGDITPILNGDDNPIVNPRVPAGPGPIFPEPPIDIFVVDQQLPPSVNSNFTGTTLKPSTYNINNAIDKVIECNCDCWIQ